MYHIKLDYNKNVSEEEKDKVFYCIANKLAKYGKVNIDKVLSKRIIYLK